MTEPAPSIVDRVRADLVEFGVTVDETEDPFVLSFETSGRPGPWTCFVWVREQDSQIVVHSVVPAPIPHDAREAVAIYLTRANYGLVVGNFELNLDDGELRFKTSLDYSGVTLDPELVRRLIGANLRAFEQYIPGVAAVISGEEPTSAIAEAERSA